MKVALCELGQLAAPEKQSFVCNTPVLSRTFPFEKPTKEAMNIDQTKVWREPPAVATTSCLPLGFQSML